MTGCWPTPLPAPAPTDVSRRTSPEAPGSWSATALAARPPEHSWKPPWTPDVSASGVHAAGLPHRYRPRLSPRQRLESAHRRLGREGLRRRAGSRQAPLSRVTPRPQRRPPGPSTPAGAASPRPSGPVFRLADYLEQHGRTARRHLCPPASFWHAAHTHLTHRPRRPGQPQPGSENRLRLQWAHHLRLRAADHGSTAALVHLARMREEDGDRQGAEILARQAADHGNTTPWSTWPRCGRRPGIARAPRPCGTPTPRWQGPTCLPASAQAVDRGRRQGGSSTEPRSPARAEDDALVEQWACHGGTNQQWRIDSRPNSYSGSSMAATRTVQRFGELASWRAPGRPCPGHRPPHAVHADVQASVERRVVRHRSIRGPVTRPAGLSPRPGRVPRAGGRCRRRSVGPGPGRG